MQGDDEVVLTVTAREIQADTAASTRHEHDPSLLATLEDPDRRLAFRKRHIAAVLDVHDLLLDQVVRDQIEARRPLREDKDLRGDQSSNSQS